MISSKCTVYYNFTQGNSDKSHAAAYSLLVLPKAVVTNPTLKHSTIKMDLKTFLPSTPQKKTIQLVLAFVI